MRARHRLEMTGRLLDILRARRRAAEAALASALGAEQAARLEEQAASEDSRIAREGWQDYLTMPGFSPEHSRSLALRLIDREGVAEAAALRTRLAVDVHIRRQADWQRLEAQARSGTASCRALERRIRRRREEDGLNRTADLTTHIWSRT